MKRIDTLVDAHTANAIRQVAKCALNVYATTFERIPNLNIYLKKDIFTSSAYRNGS